MRVHRTALVLRLGDIVATLLRIIYLVFLVLRTYYVEWKSVCYASNISNVICILLWIFRERFELLM